ncbi:MAG: DMT family transporter [Terriglobales bacterium]
MKPRRAIADLLLVAVTAVWGLTFVMVKQALQDASPLVFNAVRMTLATGLLAAIYGHHLRQIERRVWIAGAMLGLLMATGYAFQTLGLSLTTPAKAGFITGLSVVLVPLFTAVGMRRNPRWSAWLGTAVATLGLYLLAFSGAVEVGGINRGDVLVLACAVAFAGHIYALGHFSTAHAFQPLAVLQVGFAGLFTWLAVPVQPYYFHGSTRLWTALVVTAVLATALAFTVQAWAQQFVSATHAALLFTLEPVFACAASYVWEHERLHPRQAVGSVLILVAIVVTELAAPQPVGGEALASGVP